MLDFQFQRIRQSQHLQTSSCQVANQELEQGNRCGASGVPRQPHWNVLSRNEIIFAINVVLQRYAANRSVMQAKLKYLQVISHLPLYGCTKIFAHYRGIWPYGAQTVLAVDSTGIKFVSVQVSRKRRLTRDVIASDRRFCFRRRTWCRSTCSTARSSASSWRACAASTW